MDMDHGPRVLGLDISLTDTGAVVYDGDEVVDHRSIKTKPSDPIEERVDNISTEVLHLWRATKPLLVVYDQGTKSKFTDDRIYRAIGVVTWRLWRRGAVLIPMVSNTMLKEFTGHGGGTSTERKSRILAAVAEVWDDVGTNHNLADAFGFAWLGNRDHARFIEV